MLMQADVGKPFSAHVIVLGNEKGGSGKSTTAMHIAVALLQAGQRRPRLAPAHLHPLC
jgi:chromosome partitioning protein